MNWPIIKQTWIVSGVLVNFISMGFMECYTSCLLPSLRAADSPIKVDLDVAAWLGSIVVLLMAPSYILASILTERFGRKRVYAMISIVDLSSWILVYWSPDIKCIMFARLLGGTAMGCSYALSAVCVAEYTSPKYRGFFVCVKTLSLALGTTIMHVLAHYFDWRTVALISAVPSVISLVNSLTWVESPSWLLSKNRFDEFEETFYWLRGRDETAVKELDSMMRAQKARLAKTRRCVSFQEKATIFLKKFKQNTFIRPLVIYLLHLILKQAIGEPLFTAFVFDIMAQLTSDDSNKIIYVIIFDVAVIICTVFSCMLIKLMGRKTLILLSGIPAAVIIITLSVMLYWMPAGSLEMKQKWIVPLIMAMYLMTANLGCSSVPLVIFAEIFPLPHRESGTAVGGCIKGLTVFLAYHLTPYFLLHLKLYGTFAFMGIVMTVTLTCLYCLMPETKDRTLQEIEDYFEHGRFLPEVRRLDDDAERMFQPENNVHVT